MKKLLLTLALTSPAFAEMTIQEASYIGTMRMIYKDVPLMAGEYTNDEGYREYKGAILDVAAETVYANKECTYAGSYGQCTSKKDSTCTWVGKISEQCR